jgi:SAM-dependent methyltransferase
MSTFWDERFAEPGYKYGTEPNAFLREQASRFRPAGRVLVPGDGEGRNSVWLAQQSFQVLAMDSSQVGLAKAQALAVERGVAIDVVTGDLAGWLPPQPGWDAVVLTFVHLPSAIRADAHQRLAEALVPGGWLLLEAFHPDQLGFSSGGPKDIDMLYTLAQLRADFASCCDEVLGWEGGVQLTEGPGHQGPGRVTRWLGQRRA